MVDRVVVGRFAHCEHGLSERCGASPTEPHAFVDRDIHNEASGAEGREVVNGQVGEGCVGVLQGAIHDDVVLSEIRSEEHGAVFGVDGAVEGCIVAVLKLDDVHRRNGRTNGCDLAVGEYSHIVDAVRVERRDRTSRGRTEADNSGGEPAAVIARRTAQLESLQHRAVPGKFVVFVKDMQPKSAVGLPVVHCLPCDEGEVFVDSELGDRPVLNAMRPAPQHLAVAKVGEV